MSADNWMVCPKCRITNELSREEIRQMVAAQYGKIDPQQWIEARAAADKPVELEETFREDYEQGMTDKGLYFVSYHGRCDTCGFHHKFKHETQVLVMETNIKLPSAGKSRTKDAGASAPGIEKNYEPNRF